jgi:hypothetical protein
MRKGAPLAAAPPVAFLCDKTGSLSDDDGGDGGGSSTESLSNGSGSGSGSGGGGGGGGGDSVNVWVGAKSVRSPEERAARSARKKEKARRKKLRGRRRAARKARKGEDDQRAVEKEQRAVDKNKRPLKPGNRDRYGRSALHRALGFEVVPGEALCDPLSVVEVSIVESAIAAIAAADKTADLSDVDKRAAAVNAEDDNGDSPLSYAIRNRGVNADVVQVLIENGAMLDEAHVIMAVTYFYLVTRKDLEESDADAFERSRAKFKRIIDIPAAARFVDLIYRFTDPSDNFYNRPLRKRMTYTMARKEADDPAFGFGGAIDEEAHARVTTLRFFTRAILKAIDLLNGEVVSMLSELFSAENMQVFVFLPDVVAKAIIAADTGAIRRVERVTFLIQWGASVTNLYETANNSTTLILAARQTTGLEVFQLLLMSAFDEFRKAANSDVGMATAELKKFIDHQPPRKFADAKAGNKNTALHIAVIEGHIEQVRFLIAAGATGDLKNAIGLTPLNIASRAIAIIDGGIRRPPDAWKYRLSELPIDRAVYKAIQEMLPAEALPQRRIIK